MIARLRRLWSKNPILLLALVAALAAFSFFGVKSLANAIYWWDPAHKEQPLKGWMTPHYVSLSYKIPPDVLLPALSIDPDAPRQRVTLDKIAARTDMTLAELQVIVSELAAEMSEKRSEDRE